MANNIQNLHQLNDLLFKKESKITKLKEKIRKLKYTLKTSLWAWKQDFEIPSNDFRKDLPVPRLEMIIRTTPTGSEWIYGIVRNPHQGMLSEWKSTNYLFTPLSCTTTSSKQLIWPNGNLDKPFRDHSHFIEDMKGLNLKGFITCPELSIIEVYKDE